MHRLDVILEVNNVAIHLLFKLIIYDLRGITYHLFLWLSQDLRLLLVLDVDARLCLLVE